MKNALFYFLKMKKCFCQLIAQRFRLDGMKDIPTSLAYLTPGSGANKTEPLLAVGDDNGDVFILRFLKPTQSLFKKREVDDIQQIYWRVRSLKFYVPFLIQFNSIQSKLGVAPASWNGFAHHFTRDPQITCATDRH